MRLSVTLPQLHELVHEQRGGLTCIRSSIVECDPEEEAKCLRDAVILSNFPSVLHLTVICIHDQRLPDFQPLQLSSLTIRNRTNMDKTCINARALCLHRDETGSRKHMQRMLQCAPRESQQLALSDMTVRKRDADRAHHVFPSADTAPAVLSHFIYLEFVVGLTLADLTYLLTAVSPPPFAAQLAHLRTE